MSTYIGVDGCKAGWFAVTLAEDGEWSHALYETADALLDRHGDVGRILIDIPIGLVDQLDSFQGVRSDHRDDLSDCAHHSAVAHSVAILDEPRCVPATDGARDVDFARHDRQMGAPRGLLRRHASGVNARRSAAITSARHSLAAGTTFVKKSKP